LKPSAIDIAGMVEASAPTGEFPSSGGWKPITAYSLRRLSGSLLSGSPPSEPFSFLKRATRFSISSRGQARMFLQSSMLGFSLVCVRMRRE
jgi:hypothetical protein